MESSEVIIVGAGASGLAAAHHLFQNGKRPLILESSDRVGGRIHTVRPSGVALPVELGAEFVHGEPDLSLNLMKAGRLPFTEWSGKFLLWEKGKLKESDELWEKVDSLNGKLRVPPNQDVSWGEAVEKHAKKFSREIQLGSYFIQGFHGADPSLISLKALKKFDDSEQAEKSFRIVSGYDSLLALLRDPEIEIRLRHRLKSVQWKKGRATLIVEKDGEEKRMDCKHLLLTMPLTILKELPFEPSLSEKARALSCLETGLVTRVTLEFKERFWDPTMTLMTAPGVDFPTWWTSEPVQSSRIVAWAGFGQTLKLCEMSESEIVNCALESAAKIFRRKKTKLESELVRADYHNWTKDPHVRGAYSYVKKGGISAQSQLAKAVEDTIFFAGEACHHRGSHATVDGAMETGIWAARDILKTSLWRKSARDVS